MSVKKPPYNIFYANSFFRQWRDEHRDKYSTMIQLVFHEVTLIANDHKWPKTFFLNTGYMCETLGINRGETFTNALNTMFETGLLVCLGKPTNRFRPSYIAMFGNYYEIVGQPETTTTAPHFAPQPAPQVAPKKELEKSINYKEYTLNVVDIFNKVFDKNSKPYPKLEKNLDYLLQTHEITTIRQALHMAKHHPYFGKNPSLHLLFNLSNKEGDEVDNIKNIIKWHKENHPSRPRPPYVVTPRELIERERRLAKGVK